MKKFISAVLAVMTALCAAGCSNKQESGQLELPIFEAEPVSYVTAKAEVTEISQRWFREGEYTSPYSQKVTFSASGQIKDVFVDSGQLVKKGDLLCTLYNDDLEEQIEDKKVYVDQAKKTYNKLLKTKGVSKNEIEVARIDCEIQQLEYDRLVSSREDYSVYAPCDGMFIFARNHYGQFIYFSKFSWVSKGTEFGSVYDESETFLTCVMQQQPLTNVNFGTHVDITQGQKTVAGTVIDIIKDLNDDYVYVIRPENDEVFLPWTDINVSFNVYSRSDVVVVPKAAVKTIGDRKFVNLLIDGIKIEQDVETGIVDGDKIEIVGGLMGGEELILN